MDSDRWRRLDGLFEAVAALSPRDRRAHLDSACADDPELRDEVLELCDRNEDADPISKIIGDAARELTPSAPAAHTEELIGPYTIVEEIGSGGMGTVYRAVQSEPVKREVALKLIGTGFLSNIHRARFLMERQVLARMQHPGIAQIFDSGITDDDRPWFAMELVAGDSITVYADQHALSIDARLRLFVGVCRAIEHAHQKNILHRDLKPSNILVTDVDGGPRILVIDFGIAKDLDDPIVGTMMTGTNQLLGTPAYMSPEQARGDHLLLDTRSDIYSLGVVLYELLVGQSPHGATHASGSGWYETVQRILEEPVRAPSTRFGTDTTTVEERAKSRSAELGFVVRRLRGDIDWILLRALAKEPERRYQSAADFADDLERHFADQPILAGPESLHYRASKFLKRNRIPVAAATIVFLALVTALAVSLTMTERAQERLRTLCLTLGQRELLAGRPERALPYFAEVYRQKPTDPSTRELVGRAARVLDARVEQTYTTAGGWYSSAVHPHGRSLLTATLWPGETDDVDELFRHTLIDLHTGGQLAEFPRRYRATPGQRFSSDGSTLVLIEPGERIHIFDGVTGETGPTLEVGKERVVEAIVSGQQDRVVLTRGTYRNHGLELWQVTPPRLRYRAPRRATAWHTAFDASGERLAFATEGQGDHVDCRVLTDRDPDEPRQLSSQVTKPRFLTWTGLDDQVLLVGPRIAELWSADDGQLIHRISHTSGTGRCALVGTSSFVKVVAGTDLQVWNFRTGTAEPRLAGHTDEVHKIRVSADGMHMISVGNDGVGYLWDRRRLDPVARLLGTQDALIDIGYNESMERAITIGMRGDITTFDLDRATAVRTHTLRGSTAAIHAHADGKRWILSQGRGLQVVQAGSMKPILSMPPSPIVSAIHVTGDGEAVVTFDTTSRGTLRDLGTGEVIAPLEQSTAKLRGSAISPLGSHFLGVVGESLVLWELPSGRRLTMATPATKPSGYCAFSPDGSQIFASRRGGKGEFRTIEDFDRPIVVGDEEHSTWRFAFLPDSRRLITNGIRALCIYDGATGHLIQEIPTESRSTGALRISPDGKQVATICDDRTVKVWDLDGTPRARLIGHENEILDFVFDATGRRIATVSRDSTARLWLVEGGDLIDVIAVNGGVYSIAFSADGTSILVGGRATFLISEFGAEGRSAAAIGSLVEEHGPWRFAGSRLVPR